MPMKTVGGAGFGVVAGDVLALRGTGLAAAETWALLCQAAQALQDLFLSNGGVVDGSRAGPVVTPHTIELTARGRVQLLQAPPDTARAYLPPEYRPGRIYSDGESEKMWMYSLGRALLDTTPRATALTGTVSVSPSSALQSVLAAMTDPDPRRRASLMNLLDVISEYCRTRLQSRPFTHIVMDMYREVVRSGQYAARKRAVLQSARSLPSAQQQPLPAPPPQQQQQLTYGTNAVPVRQNPPTQKMPQQQQQSRHRVKGALFRAQSRNSRSQPNLLSMSEDKYYAALAARTMTTTTADGYEYHIVDARNLHQRTNSQPDCCIGERTGAMTTIPQARSSTNLASMAGCGGAADARLANSCNPQYGDPIYAMPVKPFLSSQDVRNAARQRPEVRALPTTIGRSYCGAATALAGGTGTTAAAGATVQPAASRCFDGLRGQQMYTAKEDLYATSTKSHPGPIVLQRQHSSPQFPSSRSSGNQEQKRWEFANGLPESRANLTLNSSTTSSGNIHNTTNEMLQQREQTEQISKSEARLPYVPRGPPPPKPPRINTSLKKAQAAQAALEADKPQRDLKNGPRARRGQAVQRAPSRLYRAVNGPTRSVNKTQCIGPEFVVRANQPVKLLTVGDFKMSNIGRLTVILLTGQRLEVTCDPQKVTAGELFQAIVQSEGLEENFTLGLATLLAGDFAILPPDTKLNKVAPPGWLNSGKSKTPLGLPTSFMLYLRLRFFLPSLRGIRTWISKHLLYLQIRRCILEQQLVCPLAQLINLTGLALQAEFGNYSVNEHGCGDYFLLEHYVPESLILNSEEQQYRHPELPDSGEALRKRLQQAHRERRGLDANKAEEIFITHAQALPDYGAHYYIGTADTKELEKMIARQKKFASQNQQPDDEQQRQQDLYIESENIYDIDKCSDYPIYGKIDFNSSETQEQNLQTIPYTDEQKILMSKTPSNTTDKTCSPPIKTSDNKNSNSNSNKSANKTSKFKRSDTDVWLAIHSEGLKVFERGGRLRERFELAKFQWKDIQTLSYGKNYLMIYSRMNGKRCKFKLRMDHRKSYYAFKLTSLHHQFFLKLRSELISLQGLAKDFGVPLAIEPNSPQPKMKAESGKTKISIADSVKKQQLTKYPSRLEEQQNKENENPLKEPETDKQTSNCKATVDSPTATPEENSVLYAQVNTRLEPEGESRDTEDESDRALIISRNILSQPITKGLQVLEHAEHDRLYNYANIGIPYADEKEEYVYTIPKSFAVKDVDIIKDKIENAEDLYAAINKAGLPKKTEFTIPDGEQWKEIEVKKFTAGVENLTTYGTNRQNESSIPPNMPRPLEVKTDSRSAYSSFVQRNPSITDDLELLSLKSETASIRSTSAKSVSSPVPEAYVLNTDLRTSEETFRIPDETMSTSLMARLDELSFAEERLLRTIKLERGHGGSIGLQVTEGNDGGVYVQAVSVGGSADMAGNVNKGDRIVAINGQSLLNLGYEESLKLLQSSSETVELVLSQIVQLNDDQIQEPIENNYLQNLRYNISSDVDNSAVMSSKWLQKTIDVASVQNTSSAYSSAASSAMGNHNVNSLYVPDIEETNAINSASMLLSLEDLDVNKESPLPPPVPPRRKRYKTEAKCPLPKKPITPKPERKHRPAPSPSPTAPHRTKAGRKTLSPSPDSTKCLSPLDLQGDNDRSSLDKCVNESNGNEYDWCSKVQKEKEAQEKQKQTKVENLDYDDSKISRSSSPFSTSSELNKYPSLLFTYEDFQAVIDDSLSDKDTSNDDILEQIEKTSKKVKKITKKIEQVSDKVEEISEKIDEISGSTPFPFMENISFENVREEIYFRVTTTDRPFEKCLGDWNVLISDKDNENAEEARNDTYMFEDYMDRSNRLNARPHILKLNEELNSITQDDSSALTENKTTRVRFIVESPSTSTPDLDLDDDGTSYGNFIEKTFLNCGKSTVQLYEVTDDEVDSFSKNSLNIEEDREDADVMNNFDLENLDDENVSDSFYGLAANQINDSYSEWDEDIDIFSSGTFVEEDVKNDLPTDKYIDRQEPDDQAYENNELDCENGNQLQSYEHELDLNDVVKETCERKTILIDSSCYNLSEEDDWEIYFERKQSNEKENENSEQHSLGVIEFIRSQNNFTEIDERDDTIDDADILNQNKIENPSENIKFDKNENDTEHSVTPTITNDNFERKEKCETAIDPEKIPIIEISPADDKSVPGNVLRNSFLETMLSCNNLSQNSWATATVNCEVIAAHPKQDLNALLENQPTTEQPENIDVVESETEVAPRNSSEIKLTESGARSKALERINGNSSDNKNAGEVKTDVLNELLTNFSLIKLKPVNTHVKESAQLQDSNEVKNPVENSIEVKTDDIHETTQADVVLDINPSSKIDSNLLGDTIDDINFAPINNDTSAIKEKASPTKSNDNDNKTTTPVVVNKDQSREAVLITPGSVKSFVKYYEIQSEICSIAKIKDNLFKKQSERAKEKHKTKMAKSGEKVKKTKGAKSKDVGKAKDEANRNPTLHSPSPLNSPKSPVQKQSCLRNPSPKAERKKSVQFDSEHTVIIPSPIKKKDKGKEKEKHKDDDEGTFSSLLGGIKTKLKINKSPVKSSVNMVEQNGLKLDQHRAESAAIICIQKSPEAKAVACSAIPGNSSFLPKTETLQSNHTIVFYCTL